MLFIKMAMSESLKLLKINLETLSDLVLLLMFGEEQVLFISERLSFR